MDGATERIAENEVAFRRVNEAIEPVAGAATYVCECGQLGCTDTIELARDEYEAVRTSFTRFVVLPGHVVSPPDKVVEEHDGYLVVEKVGEAAAIAGDDDPRDEPAADEASP